MINNLAHEFTMNSLSFSSIKFEFTICFVNRLWIFDHSRKFAMNSLFISWIYNKLTIYLANILWNYQLFRNLTLFWQVWPKVWPQLITDDFLWPDLTSNNFEFQFPTKFWVYTYVYLIYFAQPTRFDPFWTGLTQVWPLMTLIDLEKYLVWIFGKILSRNTCMLDTFRLIRPIWPYFDNLTPVWPLVTFNRS